MGFSESKLKLLSVDDETEITKLVSLYFSKRGYEVIEAHSGQEAIQKIEENPDIDVLLLDVMLPDMSGVEILEQVRDYLSNAVIIMVSGVNDLDTVVNSMKLGADDYTVKPFRLGELESKIENAIHKKSMKSISDGLTAEEAMAKLSQIKERHVVLTFVFEDVNELNKFTELLKKEQEADIIDLRVGEKYEVSVRIN